jgi:hypothetical protein
MQKCMTLAVILLLVVRAFGGLSGLLIMAALAIPIGIVIGLIGLALGWLK